jgi:hypothetical protein
LHKSMELGRQSRCILANQSPYLRMRLSFRTPRLWCMLVANLYVPGEISMFNINIKAPTKHDSPI